MNCSNVLLGRTFGKGKDGRERRKRMNELLNPNYIVECERMVRRGKRMIELLNPTYIVEYGGMARRRKEENE